jgi:Mn2+/Fe2+ NRAMP family transporter
MRSALAYTSARILLFVAATGVLYLVGARGLLLLALALLVSGVVSFIVLSRQRDAMSAAFTGRIHGFRAPPAAGARAEDDDGT